MKKLLWLVWVASFVMGSQTSVFGQAGTDPIEDERARQVKALTAKYESDLKGINQTAIGKYEALLKTKMSPAQLDDAVAIRNKIAALKGERQIELKSDLSGRTLTIPVENDKNVVAKGTIVDEDIYKIDSNKSQGRVELTFKHQLLASRKPGRVTLRVHVADVDRAESDSEVTVMAGKTKLGSFRGSQRNTYVEVPLDVTAWPSISTKITFDLVPTGNDGLLISSKHSGKGAELRLEF